MVWWCECSRFFPSVFGVLDNGDVVKIRSDILRIYQSLHTWTGIVTGVLLFIAFYAGALTIFKEPIDRWLSPPIEKMNSVVPEKFDSLVNQVLGGYPESHRGFTLKLENTESVLAPVSWSDHEGGRELDLAHSFSYATLDDSGKILVRESVPSALAELIDMLHRTAGLPFFAGHDYLGVYVLGAAAVLYFLALISGVILLLPTLVKDLFALREGKNRKRFWLDAHNIVGIASLPFHMVISLTAIVFAFHDQFYDTLSVAVYRDQPMFTRAPPSAEAFQPVNMLPVSELLNRVEQRAPNMKVTEMMFSGLDSKRPGVRVALMNTDYMVSGAREGYLGMNPYTGDIMQTGMLPGQEGLWGSIVSKFFSLHFGSYGGNMVRWLYFALGIGGAFLFYSGNLLWLEKRRKKQRRGAALPEQNLSCRVMASATVGVCLGSVAGVCLSLVSAKWLHGQMSNTNYAFLLVYYTVFLSSVAWAFWRGAARSGIELLMLCGISALAIPLTSLLASLVPTLGWTHASLATLSVDVTALIFALCFFYFARKAWHRAHYGAADSVWSLQSEKRELAEGATVYRSKPVCD